MFRSYTPEERAERRRKSCMIKPPIQVQDVGDDETDEADEASWIADLRAQGVDVDEFLGVATPPETVDIPKEQSEQLDDFSPQSLPPRRTSRLSISSQNSDHQIIFKKNRFTQFLEKAYVFDESAGDMVLNSFEGMSEKRWEKEVQEDSKNYSPNSTTKEKIEQNKKWAINMALKRAAEAGYKPAPDTTQDGNSSKTPIIYPKVNPPPTIPLPPIDERDFEMSEPKLNPGELGIAPPPLPHKLSDLIPKVARNEVEGIVDGLVIEGTYQEGLESCDSENMVVSCINPNCASYLHCSRRSSLVRCERCKTVSPACPFLKSEGRGEDSTSSATSMTAARGGSFRRSM